MIELGIGISWNKIARKFDSSTIDFINRVNIAGGSLTPIEQAATNQLVVDLKAYGLWDSMKVIYPMVGASAAACAQNLKSSSFTGTFTSGWTFSSAGVNGNTVNTYMNTGLIPSTHLTVNNTHQSLYIRNTGSLGVDDFGSNVLTNSFRVIIKDGSTNRFVATQGSSATTIDLNNAVPDSRGFFIMSRQSSILFNAKRNNINLGTNTNLNADALPNVTIALGALNNNGSFVNFSARQYALASIGDGLNDTQATNFYIAVQAFQTTLNRNI